MTQDTHPELEDDLADLQSAEDFLEYFDVAYDPKVVHVNRLHILQRFHDYMSARKADRLPTYAEYRESLGLAYKDFVQSDALTEKVFSVLKRASGIATVSVGSIRRAGH